MIKHNNSNKLLSIAIPSYNRPESLIMLLKSIDESLDQFIEVVICEDKSPKRDLVRDAVFNFKSSSKLEINYFENEKNYGYDRNLQELIHKSKGIYLMFMGDDDTLIKQNLKSYIEFLLKNPSVGYILRRYQVIHPDGKTENFDYFGKTIFFEKGFEALQSLFRKSVFISGFCFKRDLVTHCYKTDLFNGTLLYQLFICAEICLNHPSVYLDLPITLMEIEKRGLPEFGMSEAEKGIYTPGTISIENSINFMKSYLIITTFIDKKYGIKFTDKFLIDLSKYSYPILSVQRHKGVAVFYNYYKRLIFEIGINKTIHFNLYFFLLIILGERNCNKLIIILKNLFKRTPTL